MRKNNLLTLLLFLPILGETSQVLPKTHCHTTELKWAGWLKIATVTLYADQCLSLSSVRQSANKALLFEFHRTIKRDYFIQQAESSLEQNIRQIKTSQNVEGILHQAQLFNVNYQNIEAGDSYLIITEEIGTLKLFKNQDLIGQSNHSELAQHYFDIWLGSKPAIRKLRNIFKHALAKHSNSGLTLVQSTN